jgi:hypothetical protein
LICSECHRTVNGNYCDCGGVGIKLRSFKYSDTMSDQEILESLRRMYVGVGNTTNDTFFRPKTGGGMK